MTIGNILITIVITVLAVVICCIRDRGKERTQFWKIGKRLNLMTIAAFEQVAHVTVPPPLVRLYDNKPLVTGKHLCSRKPGSRTENPGIEDYWGLHFFIPLDAETAEEFAEAIVSGYLPFAYASALCPFSYFAMSVSPHADGEYPIFGFSSSTATKIAGSLDEFFSRLPEWSDNVRQSGDALPGE